MRERESMMKDLAMKDAPGVNTPRRGRWKRRFKNAGLALVTIYVLTLIVAFSFHVPDQLIVSPAPGDMDAPDAIRSMISYPGGKLDACTARSALAKERAPELYVLFFSGNEDRVNPWTAGVAQLWEESTGKAVEAWGVNLPGFGLSTGPAYVHRMGAAGLAAYDAVRAKAGSAPIVIHAASLGTLAAMCVAANRDVAGMTIQDPPPLRDLVLEHHGWWNGWLLSVPVALWLPGDVDSVANARRCSAPCVFITSGNDRVIPPKYQQRIVDAYAGPKRHVVIPNGKHTARPDAVTAEEIARDRAWLLKGF